MLDFLQDPAVNTMACSSDGKQITTGHVGGSVRLWDVEAGAAGPILQESWSTTIDLVFSPCYRWLTIVDRNETVRLWDLREIEKRYDLVGGLGPHLGTISADCSILKNATDLSHIYKKILIQRGAIGISSIYET